MKHGVFNVKDGCFVVVSLVTNLRIQTKSQTVPGKVQFQAWFSLGTYLIQLGVIMGYLHIVSFYQ